MSWFRRSRGSSGTIEAATPFRILGGRRFLQGTPYLLPKDDAEINRLDFQHYMLRAALHGNYAAPIRAPADILDVGSGTGRWPIEMALEFRSANVAGVDLVAPPPDAGTRPDIRPENYVFVPGNVLEGLPFPPASFDFVHQRLLVGALPAARWPDVVGELVRVTRPGGWVELVEAAPVPDGGPALSALSGWLVEVCVRRELDPQVGPKIGDLVRGAGLRATHFREMRIPVGRWGGRLGVMSETNLISFLTSIRALALAYGITNAQTFDDALSAARFEIQRGRFIWPYYVAYGQRAL